MVDSTTHKARKTDSQYPCNHSSTLIPGTIGQYARRSWPADTVRNDAMLPIHSDLGAAPTGDSVGAATSILSSFHHDGVAVLDAENFRTNSNLNNFQDRPSDIDQTALLHTHPMSTEGHSDDMWHQMPSPPAEATRYVGGHVEIPPRESHQNSTVPVSVFGNLAQCHPSAGHNVPFNGRIADSRWSGVFGTTWGSNPSQGEPFNEGLVDQQWTGSLGPTYNSDLNQGLLSHDQAAN